jgi:hypothetical protein
MGLGGQGHAPAALTLGKNWVPIEEAAGWASELVWAGAENLAPIGIRSLELPGRKRVPIPTELSRLQVLEYCIPCVVCLCWS